MHTTWWLAEGAERLRDLPVPAWLYGLGSFSLLLVLLVGVLGYGKGRPHS